MDRLHIRLRAVGRPNSSKRVRCYQKRQSSSDRKKFSHIRFLLLAILWCPPGRPPAREFTRRSAAPRGREEACHYNSSVLAVCYRSERFAKDGVTCQGKRRAKFQGSRCATRS